MQIQFILWHARLVDESTPANFPGKPPKLFESETEAAMAIKTLPKSHDWILYKVVNGKAREVTLRWITAQGLI